MHLTKTNMSLLRRSTGNGNISYSIINKEQGGGTISITMRRSISPNIKQTQNCISTGWTEYKHPEYSPDQVLKQPVVNYSNAIAVLSQFHHIFHYVNFLQ